MPFLDAPVKRHLLWPRSAKWPTRRARGLLRLFQAQWPELVYDMDLGVPLANAQAFLDGDIRRVRLYGGLVRHRHLGSAALAFTLAHETGHHLGGPPHLPFYSWLSSEERATEWALATGLRALYADPNALRIGRLGQAQLLRIQNL
jgi:hypothetical protein